MNISQCDPFKCFALSTARSPALISTPVGSRADLREELVSAEGAQDCTFTHTHFSKWTTMSAPPMAVDVYGRTGRTPRAWPVRREPGEFVIWPRADLQTLGALTWCQLEPDNDQRLECTLSLCPFSSDLLDLEMCVCVCVSVWSSLVELADECDHRKRATRAKTSTSATTKNHESLFFSSSSSLNTTQFRHQFRHDSSTSDELSTVVLDSKCSPLKCARLFVAPCWAVVQRGIGSPNHVIGRPRLRSGANN